LDFRPFGCGGGLEGWDGFAAVFFGEFGGFCLGLFAGLGCGDALGGFGFGAVERFAETAAEAFASGSLVGVGVVGDGGQEAEFGVFGDL